MPNTENINQNLPQESMIKKSGFNNFMSRLFGWSRSSSTKGSDSIKFSKVDVDSNEKIGQALINQLENKQGQFSDKLESLFQFWLSDNTDKMSDLQQRKQRVDQIQYMYLNDPYVNRTVALYADEATQLDQQDTIVHIETPDPRMTKAMYSLLNTWGLTQNRIRATIEQLALYGDAFWANTVTDKGVERIHPLKQLDVTDRIEFNPVHVLEDEKRRQGSFNSLASNSFLIGQMLDSMEESDGLADMFDSKLFGFSLDSEVTVPPWQITHFRVNADGSEFYPFGTSPILGAIAPYKQTQSTITLQSLARMMSFPITIYSVKTNESMDEGRQFGVVNRVREAYDNIGVSPSVGSSEVYTVNTKIWVPKDLLDVEVKNPQIDIDNTDDIALYQAREAVALGLPKSFFGEEGWYGGVGKSGKALTQQYKPFARKVFTIQSAFVEGLADLFRIHFAITGEYDFRIPFTISMKYPSLEEDDEFANTRNSNIEVANNIMGLVKDAIGLGEDEGLPTDIIRDIISKYTFLDPVDIMKWTRDAKFISNIENSGNVTARSSEGGGIDLGVGESGGDLDLDLGGENDTSSEIDLGGGEDTSSDTSGDLELESNSRKALQNRLRELDSRKKTPSQKLREKELISSYKEKRLKIYFDALKENATSSFTRFNEHVEVFNHISSVNELMLETLSKNNTKSMHLHEELEDIQ